MKSIINLSCIYAKQCDKQIVRTCYVIMDLYSYLLKLCELTIVRGLFYYIHMFSIDINKNLIILESYYLYAPGTPLRAYPESSGNSESVILLSQPFDHMSV